MSSAVQYPLPTVEAKRQGLHGSDVYRPTHILYFDELYRNWGAVRLNSEAIKAFVDTVEIAERDALAAYRADVQAWLAKGGLTSDAPMPWIPAAHDTLEFANYENLKIASGFELHLKARLLARDFVIHRINAADLAYKGLDRDQENRPIGKPELFAIRGFHFDGKINYLPGLTVQSLKFSWLTDRPGYRNALGLTEQELDIIKDFRELRNQIHLPGELPATPALHAYGAPIVQFLLAFLNKEIVDWSNAIIARHGLRFRTIPKFT